MFVDCPFSAQQNDKKHSFCTHQIDQTTFVVLINSLGLTQSDCGKQNPKQRP